MHRLKKRKFLDDNKNMKNSSPKDYYREIFKEIIQEIKNNRKNICK
jgi:hypothetical protein